MGSKSYQVLFTETIYWLYLFRFSKNFIKTHLIQLGDSSNLHGYLRIEQTKYKIL